MPKLILIAAMARNHVIGHKNQLCWHIPEDLARFRQLTRGQAVIMGRKTWESLPDAARPLPDRQNIVVSSQSTYCAVGAQLASSLEDALALVDRDVAYVIGGEQLYRLALPRADVLELTEVALAPEGDAFFPELDMRAWRRMASSEALVSLDGVRFAFVRYERVEP